jgi:hypothetical protein
MKCLKICLILGIVSAVPMLASITFSCDQSIGQNFNPGGSTTSVCSYLNSTIAGLYNSTFSNANANFYVQTINHGLADSTSGGYNIVSYAAYQAALQANSTDAAKAFVPASEPLIFGGGDVSITSALAAALGITDATHGGGGSPNGLLGIDAGGMLALSVPVAAITA